MKDIQARSRLPRGKPPAISPITFARAPAIGCGTGEVAHELTRRGYRVSAIDSSEASVAHARDRGVAATVATWPRFDPPPVDAIAFTRSLHHIHPLDASVVKARQSLAADGCVLVEDFAFNDIDARTVAWFVALLRAEQTQPLIDVDKSEFIASLLASVPYLYRYLVTAMEETARAKQYVQHVLHEEKRLAARGDIVLLGRRIVARV